MNIHLFYVDIFSILARLQSWTLKSLTARELVMELNNKMVLQLTFGGLTPNYRKSITLKSFTLIPGSQENEITQALIQSAGFESILNKLETTGELREALTEMSFRMGRILSLSNEIAKLKREFTVRLNKQSQNNNSVMDVEFSNMQTWRKFIVSFDLHYGYPFGDLPYKFKNLIGETQEAQVDEILSTPTCSSGFGRLTRVCKSLQTLLH
jgi:hypothetical protein